MTCCSDTCVSAVFPSTPLAPRARLTDGLLLEQSGHRGRGRRPSKSPTGSCSPAPSVKPGCPATGIQPAPLWDAARPCEEGLLCPALEMRKLRPRAWGAGLRSGI